MTNHKPYVLAVPYLPLKKPVQFAGWTLAPIEAAAGHWKEGAFEARAKEFIYRFRDVDRKPLKNPAIIFRTDKGVDGVFPGEKELDALQLALNFGVLDANPAWKPDADGWWVSTADNSDLWAQPIDVADGRIALGRGLLVAVNSGGWKTGDANFEVPAPLELHIPLDGRFAEDVAEAIYYVAVGAHDDTDSKLAGRITTAVRWHAKAWRNSVSFGYEDRVVMLRTAFEALTETSNTEKAIYELESVFANLRALGATTPESTEHMLWGPEDKPHRLLSYQGRGGKTKTTTLSDLGHWFSTFGRARHQIVHEGIVPALSYEEQDSPYNGPLFYVGERVLRDAVRAALVHFGYRDLWEHPFTRALSRAAERGIAHRELVRVLLAFAVQRGDMGKPEGI